MNTYIVTLAIKLGKIDSIATLHESLLLCSLKSSPQGSGIYTLTRFHLLGGGGGGGRGEASPPPLPKATPLG